MIMRSQSRRSLLSTLGVALPLGLGSRTLIESVDSVPALWFRPFEEAVREAFADVDAVADGRSCPRRRVEIGDSDRVRAGLQGCHNDRPFAGFAAGRLRIVRAGSGPGPVRGGVRLYVSTVEIVLTNGLVTPVPSRPIDFSSLPPAPTLSRGSGS